jgi:hypothetical protein
VANPTTRAGLCDDTLFIIIIIILLLLLLLSNNNNNNIFIFIKKGRQIRNRFDMTRGRELSALDSGQNSESGVPP